MSDRTVTARLRLLHNEFTKGTDAAAKGLKGVSDQAKKTSGSASRDWDGLGKSVSNLGASMTTRLTLPIVGLGAVAVKTAADFDSAFTQMQTLAGVSASEIDGLKESVLGLSGETGKAPQELAEALYFIRSSGLSGKAALDALEMSAKGAAAGLGSTIQVADAVTSAINGYGAANLSAAEATDVLVKTAQEGKAEASELAPQFGRLVPIAAELGISFDQVGGALAYLTRASGDASLASTQLSGILSKLLSPGVEGESALNEIGSSLEELRAEVEEKGLQPALINLKKRLEDNGLELRNFSADQQFLQGALQLTGDGADDAAKVFASLADSTGATDEAFGKWAESMGAKNAKAFAQFQIALIRLGDLLAPIAADVLAFAASAVQAFGELPGPLQKAAVAALALLAAVGPLTTVAGKMIKGWGLLLGLWDKWGGIGGKEFAAAMNEGGSSAQNLGRQAGPLGAAGGLLALEAAAVVALVAIHEMGKAAHDAKIKDLTEDFLATGDAADLFGAALDGNVFEMGNAADVLDKLIDSNLEAAERFVNAAEAAGMEKDAVAEAREAIERKRQADSQSAEDATANQEAIDTTTSSLGDEAEAANEAAEAIQAYADTIKATVDPVFGLLSAMRKNDEAQRSVAESLAHLNEVQGDSESTAADVAKAQLEYQDAIIAVGQSAEDVTVAAAGLNAAVAENPGLLDAAKASLAGWVEQGLLTEDQARFLARQFDATAVQSTALGETDPTVDVSETGNRPTQAQLRRTKDAVTDIPPRRRIAISTSGVDTAAGRIGYLMSVVNALPTNRNISITAQAIFGPGMDLVQRLGGFGGHAAGGPMKPGEIAWVGENGPELYQAGPEGGHVYNEAQLASMASPMASGASHAGGVTIYNIDLRGAITPDSRQLTRLVVHALNRGARTTRGVNAA